MTNCGSLLANQLVSNHPCPSLERQEELPSVSCPPPLHPRVHLPPPVIPLRQISSNLDHDGCLLSPSQIAEMEALGSKPPLLPPREWCHVGSTSSTIPVPPPRQVHLSTSSKTCNHSSRKPKSEHFGKAALENVTHSSLKRMSSATSNRITRGDSFISFGAEAPVSPTSPKGVRGIKRMTSLDLNKTQQPVNIKSSLAIVNLKACTENGIGTIRADNVTISRPDGSGNPLLSNQIIPLSQWPIPVIVIPSGLPSPHNDEDRILFDWVGPKKEAVANEYVEAPSLHSPSQLSHERSDVASPSLDGLHAITTQPAPVSMFGKDQRAFHLKGEDLHGGGCLSPCMRDISCIPSSKKAYDPSKDQQVHPCKTGLVCSRCKRCRCDGCTRPRRLPRKWIGPPGRQCMCSADEFVRVCSCLCCVQTLFYHCFFHPDDDYDPVVDPCSCCENEKCCLRWSLMVALLPLLPCLCCYCPLHCLVDSISYCYNSCTNRGCRCRNGDWKATGDLVSTSHDRPTSSTSSSGATRDLMLESESSSA